MKNARSDTRAAADDAEARLWALYTRERSDEVREQLFDLYADFARGVAKRLYRSRTGRDLEFSDLCQHAYAGLLEALDRFDLGRGAPFRSFAVHRIEGSIRDAITHMSEYREQVSWRQRLHRERLRSLKEGAVQGATTPVEQLADIAVGLALGFMLEGSGLVSCESAAQPNTAASAYESVAWSETLHELDAALESLPEREQKILRQHYLNGVGFDDLSRLLGVSKGRISQLHRSALATLRKRLRRSEGFRMIR